MTVAVTTNVSQEESICPSPSVCLSSRWGVPPDEGAHKFPSNVITHICHKSLNLSWLLKVHVAWNCCPISFPILLSILYFPNFSTGVHLQCLLINTSFSVSTHTFPYKVMMPSYLSSSQFLLFQSVLLPTWGKTSLSPKNLRLSHKIIYSNSSQWTSKQNIFEHFKLIISKI